VSESLVQTLLRVLNVRLFALGRTEFTSGKLLAIVFAVFALVYLTGHAQRLVERRLRTRDVTREGAEKGA